MAAAAEDTQRPAAEPLASATNERTEPEDKEKKSGLPSVSVLLLLFSVFCNLFVNLFVSVNFVSTVNVVGKVLEAPESHIPWFVSVQMAFQFLSMIPAAGLTMQYPYAAQLLCVLDTVLSAVLCWLAVIDRSFLLMMVAGGVNGIGAGMSMMTPLLVSTWWLEPEQVTFGTNFLMQGFLISATTSNLILPHVIVNEGSLQTVMLVEVIVSLAVLVMFFLFYRPPSEEKLRETTEAAADDGEVESPLQGLLFDRQFWVRLSSYVLLVAPGVSISAVIDLLAVVYLKLSNQQAEWITISFIVSGSIMGLALGANDVDARWMKLAFPAAATCTTVCGTIVLVWSGHHEPLPAVLYALFILLFVVIGCSTLGTMGIGLVSLTDFPFPVALTSALFMMTMMLLALVVPLVCGNQYGMLMVAASEWIASAIFLSSYGQPDRISKTLARRLGLLDGQ